MAEKKTKEGRFWENINFAVTASDSIVFMIIYSCTTKDDRYAYEVLQGK